MTEEDGRMAAASMSIDEGRRTASASAARGAPWLLAYTVSLSIVAVLSFFLPVRATALATLFQGGVALPLAFALERKLGTRPDAGGPSPAAAGDPARHGADCGAARGDPAVRRSTGAGSGRAGRNRRKPPSCPTPGCTAPASTRSSRSQSRWEAG